MKKVLGLILFIMMIMSFSVVSASESKIEIYLNDVKMDIPEEMGAPFIENGRTMVPLRIISQELGKKVDWDQKNTTVIIDGHTKIKIGSDIIYRGRSEIRIDAPAIISNNTTFVPIRLVSEVLGYWVGYNEENNIKNVQIKSIDVQILPLEEPEEGIIIDGIEYGKDIINYTTNNKGINRWEIIGSNENSILGTRKKGSTLDEDYALLNKALEDTGKVIQGGTLTEPSSSGLSDPNAPLKIIRDDNDNPLIRIRDWGMTYDEETYPRVATIMNTTIEALKYYTGNTKDAKAIFDYFDNCVKNNKEPEYGKTYTFGKTKIVFIDDVGSGVDIIILPD
ncbi:copper amine oxidase N-terminal domain-containing protein [Sedimentibacter hydroxybenzoicus DSM 7310]|uniref:Copper amine oxidase N-terminal domain-containing protein n=1 Tax=Sedimentibacter hydroxybenzoicus DSM 7310 TaxID=1123245 RepID=A0A974BHZ0_SEDHY|nr:copper amine oxidase N-terminal domain-containing protein [Sedimentibacter hydroxybenzoicus]NYB73500.1 copper amine oxidase N-terminal domain-containing protein [Sedimentibacter hydroxybenzoicus DSM 7310]